MKNIEYFYGDIETLEGQKKVLSVFDLVMITINNVPDKGLTFDDIDSRLKIKKAIEAARDHKQKILMLEDAEFNYLKAAAELVKWAFVDDVLLRYRKALTI